MTVMDNFDDLRDLCDRPDSWLAANSIYGSVPVPSQRLSLLLMAYDEERRRRAEVEQRLLEVSD